MYYLHSCRLARFAYFDHQDSPGERVMTKSTALTISALLLSLTFSQLSHGDTKGTPGAIAPPATDAETRSVVAAAAAFLDSLSTDQRKKVLYPFTPQKAATAAKFKRAGNGRSGGPGSGPPGVAMSAGGPGGLGSSPPGSGTAGPQAPGGPGMGPQGGFVGEQYGQAVWSNYPVSDVPRPGLQLGSLTASQRAAAMHLLQVLLSPKGYQKVLEIMGSDQVLSAQGQPFASGEKVYTIGIFGVPSATKPWMLQFGGHHLGLNVVMAAEHGVLTPTLTGAQPSLYTSNGRTVRVLAAENDKAFGLLNTLDAGQRKQAILNYRVGDLVLGPGHDGETIVPEGLKASAMNAQQRILLLDVISEWAGILNDAYAVPRMEDIKAGLDDTWFAWSGPIAHDLDHNGSAYYRIQGPKLIIEFSPQGVGGDSTMHVHTVYRDPTNDYGHLFTAP
jgi:hypothetical protein